MAAWSTENTVTFEAYDGHRYVDLSRYVVRRGGPINIGYARQTTLTSQFDDGRMSLVLDNGTRDATFSTITDTFTRSETDSWGSTDTGEAYTTAGTAADFDVDGDEGTMAHPSANSIHRAMIGGDVLDSDQRFEFKTDTLAATAPLSAGVITRFDDASNYYHFRVVLNTDQTVDVELRTRVAGTETTVASADITGVTHAVGTYISARVQLVQNWHRIKVWATADSEPATWALTHYDATFPSAGRCGLRSLRHLGNTSGATIFTFDNYTVSDPWAGAGRFTSGYVDGPLYPWWHEAIRVQVREQVGAKTFTLGSMFLEVPDVVEVLEGVDNTVSVNAVDRLVRLGGGSGSGKARTFASTLTEHILYVGRNTLAAYYPLLEEDAAGFGNLVTGLPSDNLTAVNRGGFGIGDATPRFTPASAPPPPGDDLPSPLWAPEVDGGGQVILRTLLTGNQQGADLAEAVTVTGTQVITITIWVYLEPPGVTDAEYFVYFNGPAGEALTIKRDDTAFTGQLMASFFFSGSSTLLELNAGVPAYQAWFPMTIRARLDPNVQEVWVGTNDAVTGSVGGTLPGSLSFNGFEIGDWHAGSLRHLQVYRSTTDEDFSREAHLEQRSVGFHGHARQKSGDRIRMICNYAGIEDGDLDIDPGVAYLQAAQLAGRDPRQVLDSIVATEQGRLFCAGDGRITFHDRRRIYNI